MKRWIGWMVALMLAAIWVCTGGWGVVALAEAGGQQVTAMDWTPAVAYGIQAVGAALGAVLLWLTYKYLVPLLKVPLLNVVAKWAVDMAEQALGSGTGEKKFAMAAEFIANTLRGIHVTVDQQQIAAAIASAWTALNLGQIAAGIKDAAAKPTDTNV